MNQLPISTIKQYAIYSDYIKTLSKNKNIIDLACADGWAGKIALEAGAKYVTFADARIENFIPPIGYTNYQQKFIDLNSPQYLKSLLSGVDTAIYLGHLYHCNNHQELLDALINSDCKDFLIDTKIGLTDSYIDSDTPGIFWLDEEVANNRYSGWHSKDSHIRVGKPNLSWMLEYFNRNNLEIKLQRSVDNIFIEHRYRVYIFHITKISS